MESVFSNFTKKTWLMLGGIAVAGVVVFSAAYVADKGGNFFAGKDGSQSTGISIEPAPQSGDELVQENLIELLNDDSRLQYSWTNAWTGASGSIQILRVATTDGGIVCKEYQIVRYAPETSTQKNVACQDGEGGWTFD